LNLCEQRKHRQTKSRELENLLAEKYKPENAYLKNTAAKARKIFL
jgi:hypothetical protein